MMTLKEQRATRLEQLKEAFRVSLRRNHPELKPNVVIELHPDAAIDLFGMELLDCPEEEWQEFLTELSQAEAEPVPPDEVTEEDLRRMKSRRTI